VLLEASDSRLQDSGPQTGQVGFQVAAYDLTKPLVIDPKLEYSTYLGGSDSDFGSAIAVDASGSAYVTGGTFSTDFPTASPFQATFSGVRDAFVAKIPEVPNRTAGCRPCAETTGEPIQTATGEYFIPPQVDLNLGGPLPLSFSRTYASRLSLEGPVRSSLGPNWMHNFELKVTLSGTTAKVVYERGDLLTFQKSGGTWLLQSTPNDTQETIHQLREDLSGDLWLLDAVRNLVFHFDGPTGRLEEIKDRNNNTLTLTYDGLGNLTQVSDGLGRTLTFTYDASGVVTDSYVYTPDGMLLEHVGANPQPFTFVGRWGVRQEGASGTLYHMRARYYDATTGRFLSRDPLWPELKGKGGRD